MPKTLLNSSDFYVQRSLRAEIVENFKYFSVITITGPRQVGKTTLCRNAFPDYAYYNLEDVSVREQIVNDPKTFFAQSNKHIILDEIQVVPQLLSYIMVAVDNDSRWRFLLTGSCNLTLLNTISQSLCGRTAILTLLPLSLQEMSDYINTATTDEILFNGLYPAIFAHHIPPTKLYSNYYTTYIERDVRQITMIKNLTAFQTFIRLCAGRVGSECNMNSLVNEVGVSVMTIKEWISTLEASYIIFQLQPYYGNINKRLVKTPKLYFYDTGLLCFLLGIQSPEQLSTYPLRGGIFENLIVVEMLKRRFNRGHDNNLFFYRENKGREVDILSTDAQNIRLYEVKSARTFTSEFNKNLIAVSKVFGEKVLSSCVLYDGTEEIKTPYKGLYNFRHLPVE